MDRQLEEKKVAAREIIKLIAKIIDNSYGIEEALGIEVTASELLGHILAQLERVEAENEIMRARVDAVTGQLLESHGSRRIGPLAPKLVECRGDGFGQIGTPAGDKLPLGHVEHLHQPSALGRPERAEVEVHVECPLAGVSDELTEAFGGGDIEQSGHEPSRER